MRKAREMMKKNVGSIVMTFPSAETFYRADLLFLAKLLELMSERFMEMQWDNK